MAKKITLKCVEKFKFDPDDWRTPNTYGNNYGNPPAKPGVYFITTMGKYDPEVKNVNDCITILYIGSSKNLLNRWNTHDKIAPLRAEYGNIQFYFKEATEYLHIEKALIKKLQPKHNIQWR